MNCPFCGAFITQGVSHCPECKRPIIKVAENDEQSSKPGGNRTSIPGQRRRRLRLQKATQEDIKPSKLLDEAPTAPIEGLAEHQSSSASAASLDEAPTLPIEGLAEHQSPSASTTQLDEAPTLPIEGLLDNTPTAPTESIAEPRSSTTTEGQSSPAPFDIPNDYSLDAGDMPTRPVASLSAPEQSGNKRQEEQPAMRVVFSGSRLVTRAAIAAPRSSRRPSMTIVVLCLAILLVGGTAVGAAILKSTTVTLPPSVLDGSPTPIEGPSGQVIDLPAGAIISDVNLASKIDNNYLPVIATATFMPQQRVYLTFVVNSQNRPGYIMVKWYANDHLLAGDQIAHNPQDNVAFFSYVYDQPTHATAELYWCSSASCSDARLAHIVSFTVQEGD